jgi:outer membrane protein assembly factor BamB
VYNGKVFAVTIAGKMVALNALTGALLWSTTVSNSSNLICSPAPTSDGVLLMGSDNGRLYSYSQANGALLKTFPATFGAINAQVAVPDYGHVWVSSNDGYLRCVTGDLTTVLWQRAVGAAVPSAPFVLTTNNSVYVTTAAKTVVALNASNGGTAVGWPTTSPTMAANIGTSAWADGASGIVAFAMDNHWISGVNTANGAVPADMPLRPAGVKEFTSSPVVLNGTIYIGGTDGRLYALKRANGAIDPGATWRAFTADSQAQPGQFTAAPCLTGIGASDVVVAGNTNGWLYAFPI